MRTNWGKRAYADKSELLSDYEESVGVAEKAVEHLWGNETGDPQKVAQVVLKAANTEHLPPHILLGSDAYQMAKQASEKRWEDAEKWKAVSEFTDVKNLKSTIEFPNT